MSGLPGRPNRRPLPPLPAFLGLIIASVLCSAEICPAVDPLLPEPPLESPAFDDAAHDDAAHGDAAQAEGDEPQERSGGWRLVATNSLYLREHAENPVEWYPWGEEAFARAQELDVPIFLSIGYSSCHWCHVMRRESFSDPKIAAYLAKHFVSIKVDREDLPHVDAIYMDAVRAMSGRGGWPLSVFLTPDGKPFFGGTYFPPTGVPGRPGFTELIEHIEQLWRTQRDKVFEAGSALTDHLANLGARSFEAIGTKEYLDRGLEQARERFDSRHGGWRDAPKFPDPRLVDFLLASSRLGGRESDAAMAIVTLKKMRAGGVYDQIRGGFHRYSVDAEWAVPHFEKMLYSQGLLGESYVQAFRLTGDPVLEETARGVLDALLLDFQLEGGAFAASWDADSGGEEGTYYVWTPAQVDALFSGREAVLVKSALGVTETGNFEGGATVLARKKTIDELAVEQEMGREQVERVLRDAFAKMVEKRGERIAPKRDDKVILGWNATAISALSLGAVALREDRYRRAAQSALRVLRKELVTPEGFKRRTANGATEHPASLVDAALYLKAVLDTYEATFDPSLVEHARNVARWIDRDFGDAVGKSEAPPTGEAAEAVPPVSAGPTARPTGGALFEAPADLGLVLPRRKQHFGSALPSSNGTHARNLLRLHGLTGSADLLAHADAILAESLAATGQAPSAAPELLIASLMRRVGVPEVVIAGDLRSPVTRGLLEPALRGEMPFRVIAHRPPGDAGVVAARAIPILEGRSAEEGQPTAWFCVNFVCDSPTRDAAILQQTIQAWLDRSREPPAGPKVGN